MLWWWGGLVVSVLAHCSEESSSNPVEVNVFLSKIRFEKNEKSKKKLSGLVHFIKQINVISNNKTDVQIDREC